MTHNKHGLARKPGADIRRRIRRECGFGCVICGYPITEYEHIEPEFPDCKVHDPERMALLCRNCHGEVTSGRISKREVFRFRSAPKKFKNCTRREAFHFPVPFELHIGSNIVRDVKCVVRHSSGEQWFTFDPPEEQDEPPQISAKFFHPDGQIALEIVRNEWNCSSGNWDVESVGPCTTVRRGHRDVMLRFHVLPKAGIALERLDMSLKDSRIEVRASGDVRLQSAGSVVEMSRALSLQGGSVFEIP